MISSLVVSRDKIREQASKPNIKKALASKEENIIALLHKCCCIILSAGLVSLSQNGCGGTGSYSNFLAASAKMIKQFLVKKQLSRLGLYRKIEELKGIWQKSTKSWMVQRRWIAADNNPIWGNVWILTWEEAGCLFYSVYGASFLKQAEAWTGEKSLFPPDDRHLHINKCLQP